MEKQIYTVGGYVRDMLLGIPSADKDYVAVGFKQEELENIWKKVGKDFPVYLNETGDEVALARIERSTGNGYGDFKTEVKDVTIEEDLYRRDLTINAIAIPTTKMLTFIDPYGGRDDIKSKTLRHVSEAFKEDPVRVLRLARLRCKLPGYWKVAPETKVLIYNMREQLQSLTKERVWKEVSRALVTENPHIFFETLFELGVLDVLFPEVYELTTLKEGSKWHQEASVFQHTMWMMKKATKNNLILQLACLYHDIAKPVTYRLYGNGSSHDNLELVEPRIKLDMPTNTKKQVLLLIKNHLKIARFEDLSDKKRIDLLVSYKKDIKLFMTQLLLQELDAGCTETTEVEKSTYLSDNIGYLIKCFHKINSIKLDKEEVEGLNPDHIKQILLYKQKAVLHQYFK
jgi:tRNA nucleotidyltransferase (CCA-adding enzyme)